MSETTPEFGTPKPEAEVVSRSAAYAVTRDAEGRFLVVRGESGLFLPGGGAKTGESPESTVLREILEEVGAKAVVLSYLGHAVQHFSAHGVEFLANMQFFVASVEQGDVGSGEHEVLWLHAAELSGRFYHESHEWAVRSALESGAT